MKAGPGLSHGELEPTVVHCLFLNAFEGQMLCKLRRGGMVWSAGDEYPTKQQKQQRLSQFMFGEIEAKAKIEAEVDGHEAISVPDLGYDCFSCACCKCLCDFFSFRTAQDTGWRL